jgi:hypothetical protein
MPKKEPEWKLAYVDGKIQWWYAGRYYSPGVELRDNFEFEDVMRFDHYERGRSAAYMVFKSDKDGGMYHMFLKDFEDLLLYGGGLSGTAVWAKWTFVKRGQNYGIRKVGLVVPKKVYTYTIEDAERDEGDGETETGTV